MKPDNFIRKSGFLFLSANLGSLIQLLFQAVMGRLLTDPQFGLMNTLFCTLNLAGTVTGAIQMDVTRRTTVLAQSGDVRPGLSLAWSVLRRTAPWGLLVAVAVFLGRDAIAGFFNVTEAHDILAVGIIAAGLFILLLSAIANGFFSGMQWFGLLGVLGIALPVLRIAIGAGLTRLGMGTSAGAIATVAILAAPPIGLACYAYRHRSTTRANDSQRSESIFWLALLAIGVNTLLTNADLVLVKHYFPEQEAAAFASAGVFGRAMVFFLGPLGMVLLPLSTVQVAQDAHNPNRVLWECLRLCLVLGILAATLGGLLAAPALWFLRGRMLAPEVVRLLSLYLWAMLPIALVTVIINHVLAVKSWRIASQTFLLAALHPLAIVCWHPSLHGILLVNFVAGGVILLFLLWRLRQPEPPPAPAPPPWKSVSVIMPAYNEARRIREAVLRTHRELQRLTDHRQVVAVDDGSTDDTVRILEELARELPDLTVVPLSSNRGKGEALRQGFYRSNGELVFFLDADMDLPPEQMNVLLDTMQAEHADAVIGCKLHPLSRVEYPFHRRIISYIYFAITRWMFFGLSIHDTQTGLKVFRRAVLEQCVPRMLVKAFASDLELLVLTHYYGFRIAEAPVVVEYHPKYGFIPLGVMVKTGIDTLAIFYRLYVLKYYDKILSGRIPTP